MTSQVLSALRYLIQFNGLNEAKWSGLRFQNDLSLSWVSPIKRFLETLLFMYLLNKTKIKKILGNFIKLRTMTV